MNKNFLLLSTLMLLAAGCGEEEWVCSEASDPDADGLNDCEEEALGTDMALADSDGDGLSDFEEVECVSDPLNGDEVCYACGWEHNDPGNLESTGDDEGDVIENLALVDQCGETVDLWDFHGEYHILYVTAAW